MKGTVFRLLLRLSLRLSLLLVLLAGAPAARALCVSPLCSCSVSTTALLFGAHNPLAGATDSSASVRVNCGGVAGLLIPFRIDLGRGGAASYAPRRLSSGTNTLAYNLYADAGRTSVWGDGTGGSVAVDSSVLLDVLGWAPTRTFTVYGRIGAGQTATVPGSYADSISVTVTYY